MLQEVSILKTLLVEFIQVLQGSMVYRHLNATYSLTPGDSLFFDSNAPHGPEKLVDLPMRFLSVISQSSGSQQPGQ